MNRSTILVYGSFAAPGVPCGVTAAMQAVVTSSLATEFDFRVISTRRDSDPRRSLASRIGYGVRLASSAALEALSSGADLLDVHVVSGRDLLKNAAVVLAARLARRPVIMRVHGGNFTRVYEEAALGERWLIRRLLCIATRVVVLSQGWADAVATIEPGARIVVIPNSVDCDAYGQLAARRDPDAQDVLLLGNLCERKGHFDALTAVSLLRECLGDARFLFAGADRDKGARAALEARAHELGVEGNVEFLGPVFGGEKDAIFVRSGVFILPSHVENMPVSLMEAMAAGLPVVASRVGAVAEMVDDGETGYLIDARDARGLADRLGMLLMDGSLRQRVGAAGRARARALWDTRVVAAATEQLYRSLLR